MFSDDAERLVHDRCSAEAWPRCAGEQPLVMLDTIASHCIIFIHMEFEFDPVKSESNMAKHGIDFVGAQRLWEDMDVLEVPARTEDEPRYLVIGQIELYESE